MSQAERRGQHCLHQQQGGDQAQEGGGKTFHGKRHNLAGGGCQVLLECLNIAIKRGAPMFGSLSKTFINPIDIGKPKDIDGPGQGRPKNLR
jgi:hypothetical protein